MNGLSEKQLAQQRAQMFDDYENFDREYPTTWLDDLITLIISPVMLVTLIFNRL